MEEFGLKLKKPICFFDLETTGLDIGTARIVEISILKILPQGSTSSYTKLVNPEIPIPKDVTEVHGIVDADVVFAPTFKELAPEIVAFISDSDLAGYNSNRFDIPLLVEEFIRAGVDFDIKGRHCVDVHNIFCKMEPRTLTGACRFYLNKPLEGAHGAAVDTMATYEVLKAQIRRYQEAVCIDPDTGKEMESPVKNDIDLLAKFSTQKATADLAGFIGYDNNGKEIFNFGKYKGMIVESVFEKDTSYYDWLQKATFPLYTKKIFTDIQMRRLSNKFM